MHFNEFEFERRLSQEMASINPEQHALEQCSMMFADESKRIVESVTFAELMLLCGNWLWTLLQDENDTSKER